MVSVCAICNSQQFTFLYSQTCSHIEDVHLLFYAHPIFLRGVELRHFFHSCLVCVICISNSLHSFKTVWIQIRPDRMSARFLFGSKLFASHQVCVICISNSLHSFKTVWTQIRPDRTSGSKLDPNCLTLG